MTHESASQAAPAGMVPDEYDMQVLRELAATLEHRSQERHQALTRLLSASPAPVQGWMPIESAPKDGTQVDIWSAKHGRCVNMTREDLGDGNIFYSPVESGFCVVRDATHYQPLPPAPQGGE